MPAYQGYASAETDARRDAAVTAMLTASPSASPDVPVTDPIFAVIAENRRLFDAWTAATKLPLVGIDPAPETDAAQLAFYAHCDDVLIQTVPQTAVGCAALARYAHDFAVREGFTLDNQNEDATDHLRVLDLIGRSPLLPSDPAEAEALALVDAIERMWAWWSTGQDADLDDFSPEAEERHTDRNTKRDALIDAAVALPATTRSARHAKALALAWIELVDAQRPGQPRENYARDGKLWFDIDAALVAAAGSAGEDHCHDVVAAPQEAVVEGPLSFELSGLSMLELLNLMEEFEAGAHHWIGVENAPWARMRAGRRTLAGEIADAAITRQWGAQA